MMASIADRFVKCVHLPKGGWLRIIDSGSKDDSKESDEKGHLSALAGAAITCCSDLTIE